jgi:uncharacterized protein (TIGR02421 family)
MTHLEVDEIIDLIRAEKPFEATATDGSFSIKVHRYLPFCCTAIHDGGNMREGLKEKCALDDFERWFEEDPFTADFIASMPITLMGNDSRFEYDLNRDPENCIYTEAWGKNVWKRKLSPKEIQVSKQKHANYYRVTEALIAKLEEKFGGCIVYDMHSYNFQRWEREVPVFNIGAEKIAPKFLPFVEHWRSELNAIEIPDVKHEAKINDVFYGRGYNLAFITERFSNTLVLATEVKKIFCNELTGESYPKVISLLQRKLKKAIVNNAHFFCNKNTSWNNTVATKLLDQGIDKAILKVDKGLYDLLKSFELLAFVNPTNTESEQKRFFKSKFTENPKFKYRQIHINAFELKQQINALKVSQIQDVSIRLMYEQVINAYFDKIDLLSTLGTSKFLYNSLRYFGRPTALDLRNAEYLMLLPDIASEPKRTPTLGPEAAREKFKEAFDIYGFKGKIEISKRVISTVMVLNSTKTVLINPNAKFTQKELNYLSEHEIGVHMVTTMNASYQKLQLFNLGMPVNTRTQEGLAVLAEYLSGNLSMKRLRKLAMRVIGVDMMCNGASFSEVFNHLAGKYSIDENEAYGIVTRIFRGGGFTKDYLYLNGFVRLLRFWEAGNSLDPLLIGKTSINFYNTIDEMIERDMVVKPKHITQSFLHPKGDKNHAIYDYVLRGLVN